MQNRLLYVDVAMILYSAHPHPPTSFSILLFNWLPLTYFFVHIVLIMILLWAAHNKESAVAVIIVS